MYVEQSVEKTRWSGRCVVGEFRFVSVGRSFVVDASAFDGLGLRDERLDMSASSLILDFRMIEKYRIAKQVHHVPIIKGIEGSPLEANLDPVFDLRWSAEDAPPFAVMLGFACLRRLMLSSYPLWQGGKRGWGLLAVGRLICLREPPGGESGSD